MEVLTMKRTLWVLGGLVAASFLAVAVIAQPDPGPNDDDPPIMPGMGMGMMGQRMGRGVMSTGPGGLQMMGFQRLQALDLSADQWSRIREIHQNTQKQVIPKQGEIRVAQIELQQLLQAAQPNMTQVQAKVTQISTLRSQVQMLRIQGLIQVRGVLTDEQRQKFLNPSWHPAKPDTGARPMYRRQMMGR